MLHSNSAESILKILVVATLGLAVGACAGAATSTAGSVSAEISINENASCPLNDSGTNAGDGSTGGRRPARMIAGDGSTGGRSKFIPFELTSCAPYVVEVSGTANAASVLVNVDGNEISIAVVDGAFRESIPAAEKPASVILTPLLLDGALGTPAAYNF